MSIESPLASHEISTNKKPMLPCYNCIWKGLSEFWYLNSIVNAMCHGLLLPSYIKIQRRTARLSIKIALINYSYWCLILANQKPTLPLYSENKRAGLEYNSYLIVILWQVIWFRPIRDPRYHATGVFEKDYQNCDTLIKLLIQSVIVYYSSYRPMRNPCYHATVKFKKDN